MTMTTQADVKATATLKSAAHLKKILREHGNGQITADLLGCTKHQRRIRNRLSGDIMHIGQFSTTPVQKVIAFCNSTMLSMDELLTVRDDLEIEIERLCGKISSAAGAREFTELRSLAADADRLQRRLDQAIAIIRSK
jgi:hypothetical protein